MQVQFLAVFADSSVLWLETVVDTPTQVEIMLVELFLLGALALGLHRAGKGLHEWAELKKEEEEAARRAAVEAAGAKSEEWKANAEKPQRADGLR